MPNILDSNGLQTATQAELVAYYTAAFQGIYGSDINLASDTPDGQLLNIFVQACLDVQDLITSVYNSFDPDLAIGIVLDQRLAINGIQRQAGTYTITPLTVTLTQSVNLYGLDQAVQDVYTVQDNAGTQWQLISTVLGATIGSHVYNFRAALPGANLTIPNTITVPVTIVLGVASVNNPSAAISIGLNEETDAVVKIRRQQSVSLSSQGYLSGLIAALKNVNGITSAFVYENTGATTNSDGVPGHSIWVIVAGTAAPSDIAQAIYTKRNAGAGMYGQTSYVITQVDGSSFQVLWDTVRARNLFIAITVQSINGTTPPNVAAIRAGLVTALTPGVNETVNSNEIATYVQKIDPNTLVTYVGLSIASVQTATLSGVAASGTFVVNYAGNFSAAINWNDSISTIQTKVQAISGLAAAVVTGSIASQSLVFDLSAVGAANGVQGLITITSNNMMTAGSVAVLFTFNEGYSAILPPPTKRDQLVLSSPNIIILPMLLNPPTANVVHATGLALSGVGGYGTLVYSFVTNNSGGTINSSTGAYVAGATPSTDTLKVVDAFGNSATAVITVT